MNSEMLVSGDFNLNWLIEEMCDKVNLPHLIDEPTRIPHNQHW